MIRAVVALVTLTLILVVVNASIYNKEQHLEQGRTVYLELAPVDPRSLMQGDYMALRFVVATKLRLALRKTAATEHWWRSKVAAGDGWVVLDLDESGVGRFAGVATTADSADRQMNLAFRVRSGTIKFATNAFFFQEGTDDVYAEARFGEFRVNQQGEPLLVSLRDEDLKKLVPATDSLFQSE